jgi:hypothetical protein
MLPSSEKVGKVQRVVGHSSQEEKKLEATVMQKNGQINEVWQVWNKKTTAGWDATHTKISER